nr:hypothetical protein [Anaeromassilibacillus senegalensis]
MSIDRNAGQPGTIIERIDADAAHTSRNGDTDQITTATKRIVADASHAIRDDDIGQAVAVIERIVTDSGHAGRDGDAGYAFAVTERTVADAGYPIAKINRCDITTISIPWGRSRIRIIIHFSRAGDGQLAGAIQCPCQVLAAGAAGRLRCQYCERQHK